MVRQNVVAGDQLVNLRRVPHSLVKYQRPTRVALRVSVPINRAAIPPSRIWLASGRPTRAVLTRDGRLLFVLPHANSGLVQSEGNNAPRQKMLRDRKCSATGTGVILRS